MSSHSQKTAHRKQNGDNSPETWPQSVGPRSQMKCHPHFCPAVSGAANLMGELSAYVRTNSLHVPGSQNIRRDQQEGNGCSCGWNYPHPVGTREPKSQEPELGKKGTTCFYFSPFFPGHCRDPGENVTLVQTLTLCWLWPLFPGFCLQAPDWVGFK